MVLQNHAWIKDYFKVQDRSMDFSVTLIWFRVNNATTFKKLSHIKF